MFLVCQLVCVRIPFQDTGVGIIFSQSSISPAQSCSLGLCQKDTHTKPTTQPELTRASHPGERGLERDQCLWLRAPGFLGNKDRWRSALEPRDPGTHNVPSFLKEAGETQSQSLRKRKLNHRPQLLRLLSIHEVNLSSVASNRGTQTHEHSPVAQLCSKASERSSRKFKERSPLGSISQ